MQHGQKNDLPHHVQTNTFAALTIALVQIILCCPHSATDNSISLIRETLLACVSRQPVKVSFEQEENQKINGRTLPNVKRR